MYNAWAEEYLIPDMVSVCVFITKVTGMAYTWTTFKEEPLKVAMKIFAYAEQMNDAERDAADSGSAGKVEGEYEDSPEQKALFDELIDRGDD